MAYEFSRPLTCPTSVVGLDTTDVNVQKIALSAIHNTVHEKAFIVSGYGINM
jgi:hypothetical protein